MDQLFKNAWEEIINAYNRSLINSERTLQAHLYAHLASNLSSSVIICEPTIELQQGNQVIPDMLVLDLNANEVIAAVELKFVPHHYPKCKEDLNKLLAYSDSKDCFQLLLEPSTGRFTDTKFTFSPKCLMVFGVIGHKDAEAIHKETLDNEMATIKNRFLLLPHSVGNKDNLV